MLLLVPCLILTLDFSILRDRGQGVSDDNHTLQTNDKLNQDWNEEGDDKAESKEERSYQRNVIPIRMHRNHGEVVVPIFTM